MTTETTEIEQYDPADGPPTVELDKHGPVTLVRCSPTRALAIVDASDDDDGSAAVLSLGAVALLLTWPKGRAWPCKPTPRKIRMGDNVLERGADILDGLIEAGHDFRGLMRPLVNARAWAVSCCLSKADMEGAKDFSEAPKGG